ncbi:MAG: PKD domain-containing protein [Methylotetracoccus sp.]
MPASNAARLEVRPAGTPNRACSFAALSFLSIQAGAAEITLAWDPVPHAAGYTLHYGTTRGQPSVSIDVGNASTRRLSGLAGGRTYYFAVSDYDLAGRWSDFSPELEAFLPSPSDPIARFTASTESGVAPLTVVFTDTTSVEALERAWDLGDGTTASSPTVAHGYNEPGTYTVTLRVTGSRGTTSANRSIAVRAPEQPVVADFAITPSTGAAPLPVRFNDTSQGDIDAWVWEFGDGTSSTQRNPSHVYEQPGTYTVTLVVSNQQGSDRKSKPASVGVLAPSDTNGLVAAYGFEEVDGATAIDSSGNSNHGLIIGASRIAAGNYLLGRALDLNGINQWITVPGAPSLILPQRMTLEAWVKPAEPMHGWRTLLMKEDGDAAYYLYANNQRNLPATGTRIGGYQELPGSNSLTPKTWTHVAGTYDGRDLRLYVGGTLISQQKLIGQMSRDAGPLRIGGNALWGEYFSGSIDEVRIYNRALSRTQIVADMWRPVVPSSDAASLRISASANRTKDTRLHGAPVEDRAFIFAQGAADGTAAFWLDDPVPNAPVGPVFSVDNAAPFDLAGTREDGAALPLSTSDMTPGVHTVTARLDASDGTSTLTTGNFIVPSSYKPLDLMASDRADRSGASPLNGGVLSLPAYLFASYGPGVQRVEFWLDDPIPTEPVGEPIRIETLAPFDLVGTAPDGSAKPFAGRDLEPGLHTLTIQVTRDDGTVDPLISRTFRILHHPISAGADALDESTRRVTVSVKPWRHARPSKAWVIVGGLPYQTDSPRPLLRATMQPLNFAHRSPLGTKIRGEGLVRESQPAEPVAAESQTGFSRAAFPQRG